jgi:hypothetical protein
MSFAITRTPGVTRRGVRTPIGAGVTPSPPDRSMRSGMFAGPLGVKVRSVFTSVAREPVDALRQNRACHRHHEL